MAGEHAVRTRDFRGRMHQGDFLPDRQARYLLSGNFTSQPKVTLSRAHWSHANLNNKKLTDDQRKDEIERGSVQEVGAGAAPSPFFRPGAPAPPTMVTYLGERNISMWSCDLDSFDFKSRTAQKIVDTVMSKLEKNGKGIILMHDFQKHTAEALPEIMKRLKAGGYKVVQVKAKAPLQTSAKYDEELVKDVKLPPVSSRPVNSVVQTISE